MGKIMKYEFRSMFRLFIPLWLGILALSVVNRFTTRLSFGNDKFLNFITGLALFLYVLGIIAVVVVAYVYIVTRFYKGLLKEEGYLTFTLPVSLDSIIWGKALTAWILLTVTTLVCLFSVGILLSVQLDWVMAVEFWNQLVAYFGTQQTVLLVIELLLAAVFSLLYNILLPYLSMAVGHLAQKHRVGAAVLAYVVIATVLSTLYNTFLIPSLLEFAVGMEIPITAPQVMAAWISRGLWVYFAICVVTCVLFYFPTRYILSKKLNLE